MTIGISDLLQVGLWSRSRRLGLETHPAFPDPEHLYMRHSRVDSMAGVGQTDGDDPQHTPACCLDTARRVDPATSDVLICVGRTGEPHLRAHAHDTTCSAARKGHAA